MLKQGSTGEEVKSLQRRLGVKVDGVFGPETEKAVREFQSGKGLDADGVVGPLTEGKLYINILSMLREANTRFWNRMKG